MKVDVRDVGGVLVRSDDRYKVFDNRTLHNLVVSKTELQPGKQTGGHSHKDVDEVYVFVSGSGQICVDGVVQDVKAGDIVLIPGGAFHQVRNDTPFVLEFVCVFQTYTR